MKGISETTFGGRDRSFFQIRNRAGFREQRACIDKYFIPGKSGFFVLSNNNLVV
jgi:hypothetical protein